MFDQPSHLIWNSSCMPKVGAYSWLALKHIIHLGLRLDRMGITSLSKCTMCNNYFKSIDHLSLQFDFFESIWCWLQQNLLWNGALHNKLLQHFQCYLILFKSSIQTCLQEISPSIAIWNIWLKINSRIFRKTTSYF